MTLLVALASVAVVASLLACAPRPAAHREGPALSAAGDPRTPAPGVVDGATAAALARRGALIVDVRTPEEFAAGHVKGAVHIPYDEMGRRAGELGGPETPVVVYCRSGRRSALAAQTLRGLGFAKVWDAQRNDAWPAEYHQ